MNDRLSTVIGLALLLACRTLPRAQAEDPDSYGDDYATGRFGRLRYLERGVTVERAPDTEGRSGEEEGQINAPIFPGDALRTGRDQRVEVQLADGSLLRLDRGSRLTLQSLPDPYAKYRDNTVLRLDRGTAQVLPRIHGEEEFRVDTPSASIYLLGEGEFRIDVEDAGATRVVSRRGVAEVSAEEASVLVRAGMSAWVEPGERPEGPTPFSTFARDGFDRWCEARDEAFRPRERIAAGGEDEGEPEVPYEVRPYYGELAAYGRWVWAPTYGWCWYPLDVGPGWRPYLDGYWIYGPSGYFWVSYEPWGWAPYHYGRWSWIRGFGWCWIPGRVFAGAWVAWSWGSLYVGWCPLDYWNRPAFVTAVQFGYYDPVAWTFVTVEHVAVRDVRRHAVPVATVRTALRNQAVVVRAPRIDPRRLAQDREWRERAARLAAEDRAGRVRPVARDVTPRERFVDLEPRRLGRLASRSVERAPAFRRLSGGERAPASAHAPTSAAPAPRAGHAQPGGALRERGPAAAARREPREEDGGVRPHPRRILEDPARGRLERAASPRGRSEAGPADSGAQGRRQGALEQQPGTRERVREMYRQLARPRAIERPAPSEVSGADRERQAARDREHGTRAPHHATPQIPQRRIAPPGRPPSRPQALPARPAPPRAVAPSAQPPKRPDAVRPARPGKADRPGQRPQKKDKD